MLACWYECDCVSAWRHAMLFNGPCPFQAAGRHARCTGCGTVIRATVEDKYRVVLFADMLRHVQMEHAAEFADLLALFNKHARERCSR